MPVTQILVCIDGSTDGTGTYVEQTAVLDPRVKPLVHGGNAHCGRAATRNLALSLVDEGYVWFVDSDMELDQDALTRHLETATETGEVSVGAVEYTNRATSVWAGYLHTRGRNRYSAGAQLPYTQFTTANSLVRAGDVLSLGGFDERFTGYGGEDVEFAWRLSELGSRKLLNNRRALARTIEDKTAQQAMRQFEAFGAGNLQLLEALHPEAPQMFQLQRLSSGRPDDRLFVLAMNGLTDLLAELVVRAAPARLRNHALNYQVIRAVWKGYRRGLDAGRP